MKPRTRIQKEVALLSAGLPSITKSQKKYAIQHCFEHIGKKYADGRIVCTECGHVWKGDGPLTDALCGCRCPNCEMKLDVQSTRRRVFRSSVYYGVITTCKGYQVIRFYLIHSYKQVGHAARYDFTEVVQRWISAEGKVVTISRPRCMALFYYYDIWNEFAPMEVRRKDSITYHIKPECWYSHKRFIPGLIRNGFKGDFHGISPFSLLVRLLSDSRCETLLKAGQIAMLRYAVGSSCSLDDYWSSIKICIRNGYIIPDGVMWKDYVDALRYLGKDIHNAKFVCPSNLTEAHDQAMAKRLEKRRKERIEEEKKRILAEEDEYRELKSRFFGLSFTDGTIHVRVLESVREFYEEGKAMHHCVFSNEYYKKTDSLILSATIEGKRVETVEVGLDRLKVIQSQGVCNTCTEHHDKIVRLVNRNMKKIRERKTA